MAPQEKNGAPRALLHRDFRHSLAVLVGPMLCRLRRVWSAASPESLFGSSLKKAEATKGHKLKQKVL